MDEPERMLEQTGSALERALLREGRAYQCPKDLRSKTLSALGLASTAGLATGGALAWLSAKTWSTKLLLTISAAAVLVGIPVGYFALRPARAPAPELRPAEVQTPPATKPSPAMEQPVTAETPIPVPAASAPIAAASPARTSGGTGLASSSLRAELAALDAARSTLAGGNFIGALSFLDAYFRTFPRGKLHPEAEVLRIDALAKDGRMSDARKYAQEFLRRHPSSVLAARVQPFAGH